MTDEEFLRLLREAKDKQRRTFLRPVSDEGDSRYEQAARHAEFGAPAH
ncbi:hypothetical protein ACFVZH_21120 [Streptomyces sp. NPDC059534]